jgi:hypothetical protein
VRVHHAQDSLGRKGAEVVQDWGRQGFLGALEWRKLHSSCSASLSKRIKIRGRQFGNVARRLTAGRQRGLEWGYVVNFYTSWSSMVGTVRVLI